MSFKDLFYRKPPATAIVQEKDDRPDIRVTVNFAMPRGFYDSCVSEARRDLISFDEVIRRRLLK